MISQNQLQSLASLATPYPTQRSHQLILGAPGTVPIFQHPSLADPTDGK